MRGKSKLSVLTSLAIKNLRVNRVMIVPFILSSSVMLAILYIMRALMNNEYVIKRHSSLPMVMGFGSVIVAIFAFVFILYANRFLVKRRSKEFALYSILGMENRHAKTILFIEEMLIFVIISALSIIGGHIFGKLAFMYLNKIMKDLTVKLMHYTFSPSAAILCLIFIAFTFVVVYMVSCLNLRSVSPMDLLANQRKGQKEPKARALLSLIGLILLGVGYYLALTTDGTLASIKSFFIAVVLVILATYILFVTISIGVLKMLKLRRSYYKPKNFLSVSGMIYRMKANGIGLASIAVMSTALIITVGSTMSIYSGIEGVVDKNLDRDYSIDYKNSFQPSDSIEKINKAERELQDLIRHSVVDEKYIKNIYVSKYSFVPMMKINNRLLPLTRTNYNKDKGIPTYAKIETIDTYNKVTRNRIKLEDDQVIISSNNKHLLNYDKYSINGKSYKVIKSGERSPNEIAVDAYYIVVKDHSELIRMAKYYYMETKGKREASPIDMTICWDIDKENLGDKGIDNYNKDMKNLLEKKGMKLNSKVDIRNEIYGFNGGFLFIGVLIGVMFLVGTVLVTYYKQLTEGYEDRDKYQIMKKVGLPEEMIKKTASSQIIWMLFIPLFVAIVHTAVATKILSSLLGLFGVWSAWILIKNIAIVILAFIVFYLVLFKITSSIYYKIVN